MQKIVLGVVELNEAKRIRSILADRGVELEIRSNPHTCTTGGCKITVELLAYEVDLPAFQVFLEEEKGRAHDGLAVDFDRLEQVFDPEKESAICPACGFQFSTSVQECPDCGLSFSTPTQS